MCGIACAFDLKQNSEALRPKVLEMARRIRHRGPDWSGIYSSSNAILAHERLGIVDPKSGKRTKVGRKKDEKTGKLVRFAKKSGEVIK